MVNNILLTKVIMLTNITDTDVEALFANNDITLQNKNSIGYIKQNIVMLEELQKKVVALNRKEFQEVERFYDEVNCEKTYRSLNDSIYNQILIKYGAYSPKGVESLSNVPIVTCEKFKLNKNTTNSFSMNINELIFNNKRILDNYRDT